MLDSLFLLFSVASQLNGLRPVLPYMRLPFLALRITTSRVRIPNTSSLGQVRGALDPPKPDTKAVGSIMWSVSLYVFECAEKLIFRFFSPILRERTIIILPILSDGLLTVLSSAPMVTINVRISQYSSRLIMESPTPFPIPDATLRYGGSVDLLRRAATRRTTRDVERM